MKKPIVAFRKQKKTAALILSALLLAGSAAVVYKYKTGDDSVPAFAQQDKKEKNGTLTDILGKLMEG